MDTVKVSSKYQIVIPRHVREGMQLKVGEELAVWNLGDGIELVRVKAPRVMRGSAKGLKVPFVREKTDRRL